MNSKSSTTGSKSGCSKGCGTCLNEFGCVRFGRRIGESFRFENSSSRSSDSEEDGSSFCRDSSSGINPSNSGERRKLVDRSLGACMTEVSEEALSLAGKMRFEISRLKKWLDFSGNRVKEGFSFELRDMVFSFLEVVGKAVGMLEHQEVVEEELIIARQLLQLQKERNWKLQEDNMELEIQLRETYKDYGQLLVGLDTKDENLRSKLLDKEMAVRAAAVGRCDSPLESYEGNCCQASEEGIRSMTCEPQLTGADEKHFNHSEYGICRMTSDRSFHCDNCGVCLDIQLRGNHVCRESSAHDPCCICLQDASSGYQILPCGHKIHKDCATSVIRNGMRHCPVCGQSFAQPQQRVSKSQK